MTVLCTCAPDPSLLLPTPGHDSTAESTLSSSFFLTSCSHSSSYTYAITSFMEKKNPFFDRTSVHLIPADILFFISLLQPSSSEEWSVFVFTSFPILLWSDFRAPLPYHTHILIKRVLIHWPLLCQLQWSSPSLCLFHLPAGYGNINDLTWKLLGLHSGSAVFCYMTDHLFFLSLFCQLPSLPCFLSMGMPWACIQDFFSFYSHSSRWSYPVHWQSSDFYF